MSLHMLDADKRDRHQLHLSCPCQPYIAPGERADGTFGLIVEHRDGPPKKPQPEE